MQELPAMASSAYASSTVNMAALQMGNLGAQQYAQANPLHMNQAADLSALYRAAANHREIQKEHKAMPARRLVQVIIADPNENVPLEDSLLYTGEQKLTDATDQELFFEIDIKGLLEKHNAKRVKFIDKKVKERTEHLEPAKIRDLKMVVVNVASF